MKLEIVTPEKKIYSDEIDQVTIPTSEGQITVLPKHLPVITQVRPGELIIKKAGKTSHLVTGEGFAQITGKTVSVMTDLAAKNEEIDLKTAQEARKRAEEALKQRHLLSDEEFALTAATLEKALAQLRFKRKHTTHSSLKLPDE